jgi:hypothetical protein
MLSLSPFLLCKGQSTGLKVVSTWRPVAYTALTAVRRVVITAKTFISVSNSKM